MTNRELNRDVKRLIRHHEGMQAVDVINEIRRLYFADNGFTALNRKNILRLLHLNLIYRAVELHKFGVQIDLDQLT